MSGRSDVLDLAIGVTAVGVRAGEQSVRVVTFSGRVAMGMPVVGGPLRALSDRVAADGNRLRADALARLDALLDGPLTEAVARALARHQIPRRVAAEIVAETDVEEAVGAVLEHPRTQELVTCLSTNAAFAELLLEAIDSRLTLDVTDHVLSGEVMQHAIERIAASPELRRAVAEQSAGMAEQTLEGVRRRSEALDDAAERTVRGWLRRPRPQTT